MSKKEIQQNDYRAERKKRLAKNANKNKKSIDSVKVVTWVVRAASVLLVLCITAFALYQFGVPQKFLPAVKVDDRTYSVAEYSYYYSSAFQNYAQQSNSIYSTYGYLTFDYTKDPALQTTTDEDGNTITYDKLFRDNVISTLEATNYYLDKCEAEGITLSEEHKAEIEELIAGINTNAATQNVSTSRYISIIYGKGLNEKIFTNLLEEQYLVAQYLEGVESGLYNDFSDEELETAYNENPARFQSVNLRLFGFELEEDEKETEKTEEETTAAEETTATTEEETTVAEETTTDEAVEETKEPTKSEILANEMLNRITDEASFIELAREYCSEEDKADFADDNSTLAMNIKKSNVASNIGEDLAEWLYSDEREIGDKTVYKSDKYVYVVYIVKTAYREETPLVDARHILVSFDDVASELKKDSANTIDVESKSDVEIKTMTTSNGVEITNAGTTYSIDLVNEVYKRALNIYNDYMNGEKTEEAFAKLADDNSDDAGSVGEDTLGGGLYKSIEKGKMTTAFENWIYDANRQVGDVEIIMSNYGWHIMYFSKHHTEPAWKVAARETLGTEAYDEYEAKVAEETEGTAEALSFLEFAASEACKNAAGLYA